MRIGVIGARSGGSDAVAGPREARIRGTHGQPVPGKLAEFTSASENQTGTFADVAAWAEAVVLAVKGEAAAVRGGGESGTACVMDTTNPIAHEPPEDGVLKFFTSPNDSLMERLAVKAFDSVGSALMVDAAFPGGAKPTMFCGDDEGAKK